MSMSGSDVGDALEKIHAEGAPRVRVDATSLHIGEASVKLDKLTAWGCWNLVEAALRREAKGRPDGKLTAAEWEVVRGCAQTDAARNGLAEIKSALGAIVP